MEISVTFSEQSNIQHSLQVQSKLLSTKFAVYQVHASSLGQSYALKLIPMNSRGSVQYEKEKIAFNLNHHHIVRYVPIEVQYNNSDQKFYFVLTEYAKHGDFFELVTGGGLDSEILVRTYFHQLIEGLEYIHSQGLAHLDIKLDNIVVSSDFSLKIIDFDQAQSIKDERMTSGGTEGYRAPEVIARSCRNLTAADIYAAGIILYAFRGREFPFYERVNPADLQSYSSFVKYNNRFWETKAKRKGDKAFFAQDFIELVNGMLQPDPEKRMKIKDIKESSWYKGPVLSAEDLKMEMSAKMQKFGK